MTLGVRALTIARMRSATATLGCIGLIGRMATRTVKQTLNRTSVAIAALMVTISDGHVMHEAVYDITRLTVDEAGPKEGDAPRAMAVINNLSVFRQHADISMHIRKKRNAWFCFISRDF
jgi:hypothetical protein